MICPACSNSIPDDSRFCAKCGAVLRERTARVCPRCGTANDPIFQFCRACSADLDDLPERYARGFSQAPSSAYAPHTTPFQSAEAVYSLRPTPFMPDPEPEAAYYGGGSGFAQPQADAAPAPEYPQAPLPYGQGQLSHFTTAKRSRRRFKWLLCALAALFALTLLASGVFSYLDRVERSAKPPVILKNE